MCGGQKSQWLCSRVAKEAVRQALAHAMVGSVGVTIVTATTSQLESVAHLATHEATFNVTTRTSLQRALSPLSDSTQAKSSEPSATIPTKSKDFCQPSYRSRLSMPPCPAPLRCFRQERE